MLASLEHRDQTLTAQVLTQRNGVAALQAALLRQQISELARAGRAGAKLHDLNARLSSLETKAAAEAARAAATGNANVGGIAVDTGGMVQAPPGAPAAVAQVIAAGNAIATLPVHLRGRPRLVPRRRLRLLGLGQLRACGGRPGQLADGVRGFRELG